MANLYRPTDVRQANELYGASCGHAALAASLGREVCDVFTSARAVFAGVAYVSAPMMERALNQLWPGSWAHGDRHIEERAFPMRGLALIQFEGSWMAPGVPFGAQLARTHWVACEGPRSADKWIYDINADEWTRRSTWEDLVLRPVMATHKNATGWHVRRSFEVQAPLPIVAGQFP